MLWWWWWLWEALPLLLRLGRQGRRGWGSLACVCHGGRLRHPLLLVLGCVRCRGGLGRPLL